MNKTLRQVKRLQGTVEVPPSFRELLYAVLPALFAEGETGVSPLPKCAAFEESMALLSRYFPGIERRGAALAIKGAGGFAAPGLPAEVDLLDCAYLAELLPPLFFKRGGVFHFNGRPTARFLRALKKLDAAGCVFSLSDAEGRSTLSITPSGPDNAEAVVETGDESERTALLYALLSCATGESRVVENLPLPAGPEAALKKLGAPLHVFRKGATLEESEVAEEEPTDELEKRIRKLQSRRETSEKPFKAVTFRDPVRLAGARFELDGDPLLAAPFALAGLLLGHSSVTVRNVAGSSTSGFFHAVRRMGAAVRSERHKTRDAFTLTAETSRLQGRRISGELTASVGEAFPFVALAAAFAEGQTIIRDALFLRDGPIDVMAATLRNLKAMNVKVGEIEDGVVIEGGREYDGAEFDACGHPAVAMAFAVAALKNKGESLLKGAEAVDSLFPDFYFKLESLIAND